MDQQKIFEIIGYSASLLIAISLMMKSLIRLRLLNGLGALVFVFYGLLIKAYPIAILNGIIVFIDIYYLVQMNRRSEYFTLMKVSPDSTYLNVYLRLQRKDIENFFPGFKYQAQKKDLLFFVLRNTIPAGLVIIRKENHLGIVLLDYALPDYRDLKIGAFLFEDHADTLLDEGIECLEAEGKVPSHAQYLRQMGFTKIEDDRYRRELDSHFVQEGKL